MGERATDATSSAAWLESVSAILDTASRHLADAKVGEEMTRVAREQMHEVLLVLVAKHGSGPFDYGGMCVRVICKNGRYHLWRMPKEKTDG